MTEVYLVWYYYTWEDFESHYEKKLVGVFDSIEKAEKEREEWETLAKFHLYSADEDMQEVEVQKVTINKTLLTEKEATAWW